MIFKNSSGCQYFWLFFLFLDLLGATRSVYAPEPHDVGRYLEAEINYGGEIAIAKTAGPIDPGLFNWKHLWVKLSAFLAWLTCVCRFLTDAGLVDYVETLVRKRETEFNVWLYYPLPLYAIYFHAVCDVRLLIQSLPTIFISPNKLYVLSWFQSFLLYACSSIQYVIHYFSLHCNKIVKPYSKSLKVQNFGSLGLCILTLSSSGYLNYCFV